MLGIHGGVPKFGKAGETKQNPLSPLQSGLRWREGPGLLVGAETEQD